MKLLLHLICFLLGEMIVGPRKTLFMDEISTGLDSSTTFQIVKCIRNFVHQMEATVLMALLQPAPETFELFDDLILLSDGHIVYQGPREHVVEFFESLSFKLPPRKGVADFLQEVFLEESFLLSLMVIGKMIFDVILLTWYFHIPGNI
jgi:ABC-type multidrug transport system ATPase subunit